MKRIGPKDNRNAQLMRRRLRAWGAQRRFAEKLNVVPHLVSKWAAGITIPLGRNMQLLQRHGYPLSGWFVPPQSETSPRRRMPRRSA